METLVLESNPDIQTLIEKFCEDCKLRNMTEESIRRYKSSLQQMLEKFLSYLKFERKVKYKTIKNVFFALSTSYDYLVFYGYNNQNLVLPFRKRYLRMYKKEEKNRQENSSQLRKQVN